MNRIALIGRRADILFSFAIAVGVVLFAAIVGGIYLIFKAIF